MQGLLFTGGAKAQDLVDSGPLKAFGTHWDCLQRLQQWGFCLNADNKYCNNFDSAVSSAKRLVHIPCEQCMEVDSHVPSMYAVGRWLFTTTKTSASFCFIQE